MSNNIKEYEGISYSNSIGINRSVTPGIRIVNDFLTNFMEGASNEAGNVFKVDLERMKEFISSKETNEEVKNKLIKSFEHWVEDYCYFYSEYRKNSKRYILPLTESMLVIDKDARTRTKNLLFQMLYIDEADFKNKKNLDCKKIKRFLYLPGTIEMYGNSVRIFEQIFMLNNSNTEKELNTDYSVNDIDVKIKKTFREDLEHILESKIIMEKDIYYKLEILSLLFNFYIVFYLISKTFDFNENYILAKGSSEASTTNNFHFATVGNFAEIRDCVYKISEKYYLDIIVKRMEKGSKKLFICPPNPDLGVKFALKSNGINIWDTLSRDFFSFRPTKRGKSSGEEKTIALLLEYFDTQQEMEIDAESLSKACVAIGRKRSSSVQFVSAIFSGQGRECDFVYPISNSNKKYYTMSEKITELFVNLFLSRNDNTYGTLDQFLNWLQNRYGIYIGFSNKIATYLSQSAITVPSANEFYENQQTFINTLLKINCIKKISDSSYLIYSGREGDIPWLD